MTHQICSATAKANAVKVGAIPKADIQSYQYMYSTSDASSALERVEGVPATDHFKHRETRKYVRVQRLESGE